MFKGHFAKGTVEGTGSAINVPLGFTPDYVKVFNIDDAGSLWATIEWTSDMAAASGWKTLKIADNGSSGALSSAKITSNGISEYAGVAGTTPKGFTIGADTDLNASAETICYVAWSME